MFTGLIKEVGTIQEIIENEEGKIFKIQCPQLASLIKIDDSIATNGVCLTAVAVDQDSYTAQAVHTTLEKSSLGMLKVNSKTNLELAMLPTERLGGHFVQGHVNALAELIQIKNTGDNYNLTFSLPADQMKFIIDEGSIAIDGISLTVAKCHENHVTVTIIPHTWHNTNLFTKSVGDFVNIEVDMLAKYLWNFQKYKK